jgi:hypothetical protein
MATVEFRYDPKNTAWFTANAAMVLKAGEPAYHDTTGLFKLGDGVTALSALSFLPTVSASTPTIQQVLTAGQVATTTIETTGFIKTGGTSSQFLKADGSVDSNVYGVGNALTTNPLSQFAATTSSQLAGVISDETGSGALVFGTSPTFITKITTPLINGTSGTLQIGTTDLVNIGNKTTTSQRLVRIGQDTAWLDIGSLVGSTSNGAIFFNQNTPSISNSALYGNTTGTVLNATGTVSMSLSITPIITVSSVGTTTINPVSSSSGAVTGLTFTAAANTNQTLGTNIPNFRVNGANKQWATGALATQYFNYFTANTVSFVGASTATNVYGLYVEAATAGTNATITNNYAAGFGGNILINTGAGAGRISSREYSSNLGALYFNQTSPDTSNYAISGIDNANTLINGKTTVNIRINGTDSFNVTSTVITYKDAFNIAFNTTTGTKIGTTNLQKISFWNATPIVQPTTAVAAATVVSGTGGNVKHDDTFDGYTLEKIVRALRTIGLLA